MRMRGVMVADDAGSTASHFCLKRLREGVSWRAGLQLLWHLPLHLTRLWPTRMRMCGPMVGDGAADYIASHSLVKL